MTTENISIHILLVKQLQLQGFQIISKFRNSNPVKKIHQNNQSETYFYLHENDIFFF